MTHHDLDALLHEHKLDIDELRSLLDAIKNDNLHPRLYDRDQETYGGAVQAVGEAYLGGGRHPTKVDELVKKIYDYETERFLDAEASLKQKVLNNFESFLDGNDAPLDLQKRFQEIQGRIERNVVRNVAEMRALSAETLEDLEHQLTLEFEEVGRVIRKEAIQDISKRVLGHTNVKSAAELATELRRRQGQDLPTQELTYANAFMAVSAECHKRAEELKALAHHAPVYFTESKHWWWARLYRELADEFSNANWTTEKVAQLVKEHNARQREGAAREAAARTLMAAKAYVLSVAKDPMGVEADGSMITIADNPMRKLLREVAEFIGKLRRTQIGDLVHDHEQRIGNSIERVLVKEIHSKIVEAEEKGELDDNSGFAAWFETRFHDPSVEDRVDNVEDLQPLVDKLNDILDRTANALHGGSNPDGLWSFHDLPELVVKKQYETRLDVLNSLKKMLEEGKEYSDEVSLDLVVGWLDSQMMSAKHALGQEHSDVFEELEDGLERRNDPYEVAMCMRKRVLKENHDRRLLSRDAHHRAYDASYWRKRFDQLQEEQRQIVDNMLSEKKPDTEDQQKLVDFINSFGPGMANERPFSRWLRENKKFREKHAGWRVAFHEERHQVLAFAEDLIDVVRQLSVEDRDDPKVIFTVIPPLPKVAQPVEEIEDEMHTDSIDRDIDQSRRAEGKPDVAIAMKMRKWAAWMQKTIDQSRRAEGKPDLANKPDEEPTTEVWLVRRDSSGEHLILGRTYDRELSQAVYEATKDQKWETKFAWRDAKARPMFAYYMDGEVPDEEPSTTEAWRIYDALSEALGSELNESHPDGATAVQTLAIQRDEALEMLKKVRKWAHATSDSWAARAVIGIIGDE